MKFHLLVPLLLALGAAFRAAAAAPQARPASTNALATNNVHIICDGGALVTTNRVIFRKNVKAQDGQMYLECELLTAWSKPKTTNAPQPAAAARSETSLDTSDVERIDAETNVMMITAEMQVIGDRAVYTAAEDVLTFTGELVVALTAQGSLTGTNIVFNRRSGEITLDGPITAIIYDSLLRSNAPPPAPPPKPTK